MSDRFIDVGQRAATADPRQPGACPKCRSKEIHTAAKQPTVQSYWRCFNCGEIWNPSRQPDTTKAWWRR